MCMPRDLQIWVPQHDLSGVTRNAKHLESIMLGYYAWTTREKNRKCKEWVVDLHPEIRREPFTAVVPMLGQKTDPYIYTLDRSMTAQDISPEPFQFSARALGVASHICTHMHRSNII